MTLFWITAGVITALALLPLVRILARPGRGTLSPDRSTLLLAQLRAQLAELDREVARGLVAEAEADALRVELKRRMLGAADEATHPPSASGRAASGAAQRYAQAALLAGTVAAAAVLFYLTIGAPGEPDRPLAARNQLDRAHDGQPLATKEAEAREFRDALATLEQRLAERPDDVRGWVVLGRGYRSENRYQDAVRALGEAYRRSAEDPSIAGQLAEAMIVAGGGRVDAAARTLLERALIFDPRDAGARFFLALYEAQQGNVAAALQGWTDLTALAPADAPFLPIVRQHIERAAAELGLDPRSVTPSAEARALAAASPEATTPAAGDADIRAMVSRLAERLAREPNDRNGWLMLARSYEVLGEPEKAAEARARAAALE